MYARCVGTADSHLLSAESSSATTVCFHSVPTKPNRSFDLLIVYYRTSDQLASEDAQV